MYEGSNPTALKSQQWITDALVSMMTQKRYADISVKDICAKADLSRQTFYNLFTSKDDILHACLQNEVAKVYETLLEKEGAPPDLADMVRAFTKVLSDNRRILTLMIDQGLENIITEEVTKAVGLFAGRFAADSDQETVAYSAAFLSGGLTQILLYRFKQEEPMEIDAFTELLQRITVGIVSPEVFSSGSCSAL